MFCVSVPLPLLGFGKMVIQVKSQRLHPLLQAPSLEYSVFFVICAYCLSLLTGKTAFFFQAACPFCS